MKALILVLLSMGYATAWSSDQPHAPDASGVPIVPHRLIVEPQQVGQFCESLLDKTGALVSIQALKAKLELMRLYLSELEAHHVSTGTTPYAFSTPDTAGLLEAAFGP